MKSLIIDIETAPIPGREMDGFTGEVYEFRPFDPADVKCGNLKDPAKIAEKIETSERFHESNERARKRDLDGKSEEYSESATLDPRRSYIQAIGWHSTWTGESGIIDATEERETLRGLWTIFNADEHDQLLGWNSYNFDFPRIAYRCALHGIVPPLQMFGKSGFPATEWLGDIKLMVAGKATFKFSLDDFGGACGLGVKTDPGEIVTPSGRVRQMLPHELRAKDPSLFAEYLNRDIELTAQIFYRVTGQKPKTNQESK